MLTLHVLIIALSNTILIHGNDIFCSESFSCQDIESCHEGEDCHINCNGTNSCQFARLLCPKDYKCTVTCDNLFACSSAIINASRSSELIINGCTASDACTFLDIYCPPHIDNTKNCKISGADNIRKGVDYYAVYGFADIEFDFVGNYSQGSSQIFCSSDYAHSCAVSTDSFTCDPNGDISCNGEATIVSTSFTKTTRNPTNNVPFLPELGTIHVLGINVHILWLVIAALIALILCIGCCLIYFMRKSHRDAKLIKDKERSTKLRKVETLSHDATNNENVPPIAAVNSNHSNITMTPLTPSTATQSTSPSKQTISNKSSTNNRSATPSNRGQPRKYSPQRSVVSPKQRHSEKQFGSPRNMNMNMNYHEYESHVHQNRQRPYSFAAGYQNSNSNPPRFNWNESQKSMHSNSSHQAPVPHSEHSHSSPRKHVQMQPVSRHSSFKNVSMYPTSPAQQTRAKRAQTYTASPPSLHSNASQHSSTNTSQLNSSQLIQKQMVDVAAQRPPIPATIQPQQRQQNINYVPSNHYANRPNVNAVNYANANPVNYPHRNTMPVPSKAFQVKKSKHTQQPSALTDVTDSDSTRGESDSSDSSDTSSENHANVKQNTHSNDNNNHRMRIVVENVDLKEKNTEIPLEKAMEYMKEQNNLGVIGSNMAVNGSMITLDQEPETPTENEFSYADTERTTFYEDEL